MLSLQVEVTILPTDFVTVPVASISEEDEYYNTDSLVWKYGKEYGYEGEELG